MLTVGLDVLDTRAVSLRRLWVMANRLPPWARSPGEPWSAEANLLALLVDHVAELTYVTARAAGATGARRPRPLPRPPREVARPSASRTAPRAAGSGWADAARQLAAIPGVVVEGGEHGRL